VLKCGGGSGGCGGVVGVAAAVGVVIMITLTIEMVVWQRNGTIHLTECDAMQPHHSVYLPDIHSSHTVDNQWLLLGYNKVIPFKRFGRLMHSYSGKHDLV
jgi:hypothetical protein